MSNRTSEEELRVCWRAEYARPLVGWDYTANVLAAMEGARCMLDMDTGGGETVADLPRLGARA